MRKFVSNLKEFYLQEMGVQLELVIDADSL